MTAWISDYSGFKMPAVCLYLLFSSGNSDDWHNFATTLRQISPKAYDYVCSTLSLGLTDVRSVDHARNNIEARPDAARQDIDNRPGPAPPRTRINKRGKHRQKVRNEQVYQRHFNKEQGI